MGIFTGATSSSDGTSGYVPAPTAGMQDDYYLCGNGEWVEYDPTPKTWVQVKKYSKTSNYSSVSVTSSSQNDDGTYDVWWEYTWAAVTLSETCNLDADYTGYNCRVTCTGSTFGTSYLLQVADWTNTSTSKNGYEFVLTSENTTESNGSTITSFTIRARQDSYSRSIHNSSSSTTSGEGYFGTGVYVTIWIWE